MEAADTSVASFRAITFAPGRQILVSLKLRVMPTFLCRRTWNILLPPNDSDHKTLFVFHYHDVDHKLRDSFRWQRMYSKVDYGRPSNLEHEYGSNPVNGQLLSPGHAGSQSGFIFT